MDPAFDDVRFLAGSSNRVDVLGALVSGPMTRDGLLAQVEASRVTCQRILLDDVAVLGLLGDGLPRGVIESEDEVVCKWARDTFEQWRADATVLEP